MSVGRRTRGVTWAAFRGLGHRSRSVEIEEEKCDRAARGQ